MANNNNKGEKKFNRETPGARLGLLFNFVYQNLFLFVFVDFYKQDINFNELQ